MQLPDIQHVEHRRQRGDGQSNHDSIKLVPKFRRYRCQPRGARRGKNQVRRVVIAALPRLDEPPRFVVFGTSIDKLKQRPPSIPTAQSSGATAGLHFWSDRAQRASIRSHSASG